MPTIRYNPVPTVGLATAPLSGAYQNIRATADDFGGAIGEALSRAGSTLERASNQLAETAIKRQQLQNEVVANEQANWWETEINKLLYGDPETGDTGYFGKRGKSAAELFPIVRKQLDDRLGEARAKLQNPAQQMQFDQATRRVRSILLSETGRHYDREFNRYVDETDKGRLELNAGRTSSIAATGQWERFQEVLGDELNTLRTTMQRRNEPPEKIEAAVQERTREAAVSWAQGLLVRDPVAGQQFIENNKDVLGDKYAPLAKSARESALERQAQEAIDGTVRERPKQMIRGGAITNRILEKAAEVGFPQEAAIAAAMIESDLGQAKDRPGSQYKGVFQLGDDEWDEMGGGDRGDRELQIDYGVKFLAKRRDQLAARLGRAVEPWEAYLAHQQGVAGAAALLTNPSVPAGQAVSAVGGAPRNIRGNRGNPNAPSSAFTDMWRNKFNSRMGSVQLEERQPTSELMAVGDSIAAHLIRKGGIGGREHNFDRKNDSTAVAGIGPAAILDLIASAPEASIKGKDVVLSSGASNKPEQVARVSEQIDLLRNRKARNVTLLGVGTAEKLKGVNEQLEQIARAKGVKFMPLSGIAGDGVHLSDPAAYARQLRVGNVPPPQEGQLPDEAVPGLSTRLQEALARVPNASPELRERIAQKLRQKMGAEYAQEAHQAAAEKRRVAAIDEAARNEYIERLAPNSTNPPTIAEIRTDKRLTSDGKIRMESYMQGVLRAGPTAGQSAESHRDLYRRIVEDDDAPDKIKSQSEIDDAYFKNRIINWDAHQSLTKAFQLANQTRTADLQKSIKQLMDLMERRFLPVGLTRGEATADQLLPLYNYQRFVTQQIQDYTKPDSKKDVNDLFDSSKPDFLGRKEVVDRFAGPPGSAARLDDPKKPAVKLQDVSSLDELMRRYRAGEFGPTTDKAVKDAVYGEAIRRGWTRPRSVEIPGEVPVR